NDNAFHRKAELVPLSQIGPSLSRACLLELEAVQKLLKVDWEAEFLTKAGLSGKGEVPSLESVVETSGDKSQSPSAKARKKIKEKLLSESKGNALLAEVAEHFYQNGWGLFGNYRAFRWENHGGGKGALVGIESADPIRLENLVGYDEIRKPLIENIEAFVSGKLANNVLLYGERGTGKSSHVKALLNAFGDRGLRLVEVHPDGLKEFPEILKPLRGRREKFILFVDDLSFEDNETSYKGLKALLEGNVEATPANVILVATSNRRHLVREFFSEREEGVRKDSEIHGQDTVEEKLSLSDRFGVVVSFYTPNQETYLKIVESWAKVEGIKLPVKELHAQALLWARQNNGPSGRTARQFVNHLKGKT
ncbi:MAG TPA: ATP-binding protein, partial [bacterium]